MTVNYLLQETGDYLLQETGDKIILDEYFPLMSPTRRTYILEVRTTAGALFSILENAFNITYTKQLNAPHILKFSVPADDSKTSAVLVTREIWLRNTSTNTVIRKFRLINKRDIREEAGVIRVDFECLDYMSQLSSGRLQNYNAGLEFSAAYAARTADFGVGQVPCIILQDTDYVYCCVNQTVKKIAKSDMSVAATSPAYGAAVANICMDDNYVYMVGLGAADRIKAYNKADLTYSHQSAAYTFTPSHGLFESDGTNIYFCVWTGVGTGYAFYKVLCADLTTVTQTVALGATEISPNGALVGGFYTKDSTNDGTYLYYTASNFSGGPTYVVKKSMADISQYITSAAFAGEGTCICIDDNYIYTGNYYTYSVRKFDINTLEKISESEQISVATTYNLPLSITTDDNYVYVDIYTGIFSGDKYLLRLTKDGLKFTDDFVYALAGGLYGIIADTNGTYLWMNLGYRVYKWSAFHTVEEIIDDLLTYDMQLPAVTKGTIAAAYGDAIRLLKASDKTLLQAIMTLQQCLGGYVEVDDTRKLNWSATVGEDKGQQIRYRKNLTGIERDIDYSPQTFFNRVYCYGRHTGGDVCKLSEIQANDYVEDAASQATYDGVFVASFTDLSISDPTALLEWANSLLADHKTPPTSYRIRTLDLSVHDGFEFDEIQIGSTVTVIDEDLGIDVSVQVVKITYPDLLNPQDMDIELSTVMPTVIDSIAGMNSKQKDIAMIV